MSSSEEQLKVMAERGEIPATAKDRIFGKWDITFLMTGYGIATWNYILGGWIAAFLGFWPAVGALLLVIPGALFASYGALPHARFGVDQFQGMRAWFGHKGIWPPLVLVGLVIGWGWSAMLNIMTGRAVNQIIAAGTGASPVDWRIWAVLALIISIIIAWKGGIALGWLTKLAMPILIIVTLSIIFIFAYKVGWQEIMDAKPVYATGTRFDVVIGVGLGLSWLTWYVGLGQIFRLTKTETSAIGATWVGGGILAFVSGFVGIISGLYIGQPDPTEWLIPIGGLGWGIISLIFIIVANISSVSIVFYSTGETLHSLLPRLKWEICLGILFAGSLVLTLFPVVYDAFDAYQQFIYLLCAPLISIAIVDFFILKKQKLKIQDCCGRKKNYMYWNGFNWVAIGIWIASTIIGFLILLGPELTGAEKPLLYYTTDVVPVILISGISYYFAGKYYLMKKFPEAF